MIQKTGLVQLKLTRFRSYPSLDLTLSPGLEPVVLTGPNGVGKTNILEAVSFLAPGRGLRSCRLTDVVYQGNADNDGTWGIAATVQAGDEAMAVGTGVMAGGTRRLVKVQGKVLSKQAELGEVARILWLTPAQDRLFSGDPMARRRFLDRLVGAFDPEHLDRLSDYMTAFKQWNFLLKNNRFDGRWLGLLEDKMAVLGVSIAASRQAVVDKIAQYLGRHYHFDFPLADMTLTGLLEEAFASKRATEIEEFFRDYLYKARHICTAGGTVAGAHTTDFKMTYRQKGFDAALSSSGEQKALLFSLILAEIYALVSEQGVAPIVLLDEVMAHLDATRQGQLLELIGLLPAQVWMTGANRGDFSPVQGVAQMWDVSDFYLKQVAA